MAPGKKPISRLTIFFILAVVLSGSVLTWFSINNISNLKELTEKRVLEEQRELSARFLNEVKNNIDKVISGFDPGIKTPADHKEFLRKKVSESDFIIHPFILNNSGELLYPNFTGVQEIIHENKFSEEFKSSFKAGEIAEFTEKDLQKAKKNYLSCLNNSSGSYDSAKAINALGRVSLKANKITEAFNHYYSLISGYYNITDDYGNPYINYALPQIMKIPEKSHSERIPEVIGDCLEKMEIGSVPLNYNSEELLADIAGWLKNNNYIDNKRSTGFRKLSAEINKQIRFAINYGNELPGILNKENPVSFSGNGTDFKLISPATGNNNEFFLINTNSEITLGFLIDRSKLQDAALKNDLQKGFEFSYRIDFPEKFVAGIIDDNLVYSSQLAPFFPDRQIEISPVNKDLITDLVNRRSLIYGISSLMLLVAMGLGVALILRDMARERNLSQLRADFISNVTHELKTPLTSIRMYAESLLLGRVNTDDTRKEYLEVVLNESERLKRMINNILEFSKTEKGKSEYHFVKSNLTSIIRSAIQEMSYWFEKENFEIVTDLEEEINLEVDPEKIKQVIENLFSNAIKYSTDVKQVLIRLKKESDNILIEVEDRGIGIPADKISHIFEPFYRIEQKESISGTGLGLTVVKEIIDAHHGSIKVSSEPGKGSRFTIRLPAG